MADIKSNLVDTYIYRRRTNAGETTFEFLLGRRSPHEYAAGQWRMIAGSVEEGEKAWEAAIREVKEETQLDPVCAWALPSVNTLYAWYWDTIVLIPAFGIEVAGEPVLDDEHDLFAWLSIEEAVKRLNWPEPKRLIQLTYDLLVTNDILPEWYIDGYFPADVAPYQPKTLL